MILSMQLVFALIPLYLWKRHSYSREEQHEVPQRETVVHATGTRRMRWRPAAGAAAVEASADVHLNSETVDGSDDEAVAGVYYDAKASKKKEKKRQVWEAQRQVDEAARESRQSKQDRCAQMRKRKDEEQEAWERALEEEAKTQKAREEEAAALDFEKWKVEFSIEDEGTTENEVQDGGRNLLSDFVEYINKHKCVPLEDLAVEYKLRTQECFNRVTSLESMGRHSELVDDRGKYIYISQEELQAVAYYIKRQGSTIC